MVTAHRLRKRALWILVLAVLASVLGGAKASWWGGTEETGIDFQGHPPAHILVARQDANSTMSTGSSDVPTATSSASVVTSGSTASRSPTSSPASSSSVQRTSSAAAVTTTPAQVATSSQAVATSAAPPPPDVAPTSAPAPVASPTPVPEVTTDTSSTMDQTTDGTMTASTTSRKVTTTKSSSPTVAANAAPESGSNTALIGGIVGAGAFIVAAAGMIILYRRRQSARQGPYSDYDMKPSKRWDTSEDRDITPKRNNTMRSTPSSQFSGPQRRNTMGASFVQPFAQPFDNSVTLVTAGGQILPSHAPDGMYDYGSVSSGAPPDMYSFATSSPQTLSHGPSVRDGYSQSQRAPSQRAPSRGQSQRAPSRGPSQRAPSRGPSQRAPSRGSVGSMSGFSEMSRGEQPLVTGSQVARAPIGTVTLLQDLFVAIVTYTAQQPDELSVTVGDQVYVDCVLPDSWARGSNKRTGMVGFIPMVVLGRNNVATQAPTIDVQGPAPSLAFASGLLAPSGSLASILPKRDESMRIGAF
ncbi:hypothetical protein HDU93_008250 [Gonapodya sp. JEL0774]|nr:hypothetical protein HDU93_008250 [Gonapodya sp. JEL0774]